MNTSAEYEFIETQLAELEAVYQTLTQLVTNPSPHTLVTLGKGIALPAICKLDAVFVEVGAGIVLKKTYDEIKEILIQQIKGLKEAKMQLSLQVQQTI